MIGGNGMLMPCRRYGVTLQERGASPRAGMLRLSGLATGACPASLIGNKCPRISLLPPHLLLPHGVLRRDYCLLQNCTSSILLYHNQYKNRGCRFFARC
jgi:hypothetical protein